MSKADKRILDPSDNWTPIKLQKIEGVSRSVAPRSKGGIFEMTGFIDGMDSCSISMTPQEVIAMAKKHADEIAKNAYGDGFEQGERAGFEYGNKKAESVGRELLDLLQEIRSIRDEVLKQSERESVILAMRLAERIINHEVTVQEDLILHIAREALQQVAGEDQIRIVLNPEDFDFLQKSKEDLNRSVEGLASIDVEKDESIRRGGCLIQTRMGEIDTRIDNKMDVLFQELIEKIEPMKPEDVEGMDAIDRRKEAVDTESVDAENTHAEDEPNKDE